MEYERKIQGDREIEVQISVPLRTVGVMLGIQSAYVLMVCTALDIDN